jgi:hypothetical protein
MEINLKKTENNNENIKILRISDNDEMKIDNQNYKLSTTQ